MKRERVNKAQQIEMQIAHAERRVTAAQTKLAYWEQRLQVLRLKEIAIRIGRNAPLGRATKKNQKKHVVWYDVRDCLLNSAGMTTAELYAVLRADHRNLNVIAFRAYLREFVDKRLIEKQNNRWQLHAEARPHLSKQVVGHD
jgi:hypothetical protein